MVWGLNLLINLVSQSWCQNFLHSLTLCQRMWLTTKLKGQLPSLHTFTALSSGPTPVPPFTFLKTVITFPLLITATSWFIICAAALLLSHFSSFINFSENSCLHSPLTHKHVSLSLSTSCISYCMNHTVAKSTFTFMHLAGAFIQSDLQVEN